MEPFKFRSLRTDMMIEGLFGKELPGIFILSSFEISPGSGDIATSQHLDSGLSVSFELARIKGEDIEIETDGFTKSHNGINAARAHK
ncbi:hypothetical protein GHYDROH2_25030 [Geobacter hydrogenophilus]|uniref:Uncharacterized protein n=1 Tax=Geobacter hydrogenophilus TaxID=40983 RepID=A0A9W6G263_9BACT|nr:hypothetical protein GHYDROH2_25030 [Geobacter hydrogenophilus]